MNFQATNLDESYEILNRLNLLAQNEGENLVINLFSLINNLKEHWVGSDATVNINHLVDVYDSVKKIVDNVRTAAHNTSIPIVNAQTIRNSNGGSGNVGTIISSDSSQLSGDIEKLSDTKEYYVDPSSVPKDYNMLQNQKSNFDSFCTKFLELKEQLFNNWINGSDRPKTLSDFEEFENNILEFKKIFNDTEQGLSSVVANLQQI